VISVFPTRVIMILCRRAYAMGFGVRRNSHRIVRRLVGQVAVLRFIVAPVILAVYAAVAHFRLPQRPNIPGLVLSGIVGIRFTIWH
jgi:hypothetical protein